LKRSLPYKLQIDAFGYDKGGTTVSDDSVTSCNILPAAKKRTASERVAVEGIVGSVDQKRSAPNGNVGDTGLKLLSKDNVVVIQVVFALVKAQLILFKGQSDSCSVSSAACECRYRDKSLFRYLFPHLKLLFFYRFAAND
jgi:hypothetical protein